MVKEAGSRQFSDGIAAAGGVPMMTFDSLTLLAAPLGTVLALLVAWAGLRHVLSLIHI